AISHLPPSLSLPHKGGGNVVARVFATSALGESLRSLGLPSFASVPILHPGADDVIGNGDLRRRAQAVRMAAAQHGDDFLALEPARIVKLAAVHNNVARQRLGATAGHQRGTEGPGGGRERGARAAAYADLLARLPANRLLDRLARLHESGKTRPHALGKPVRAAENAALARNGEHDHDRIGARKMLGRALR